MQEKRKRWDDIAFKNIQKLYANRKYQTAKKYLIEYVENYPQDISAKSLLSKILIQLEEYEEAEVLLKNCIKHHPEHMVFVKNMIILYMEQEEYEKAYKYYKQLDYDICIELNERFTAKLIVLRVLLWHKLNLDYKMSKEEGYLLKQYKEYNKDLALDHICENHLESEKNKIDIDKNYLFYKSKEEIEELYDKASIAIKTGAKRLPKLDMLDFYDFKYKEAGKNNNEYTNAFRVVTIKNTNQIITMYPVNDKYTKIINNLEEKEEYTTGKARTRKSQIDKFYEKYK